MTIQVMKTLHVLLAAVSISGFALRGFWMLTGSALLGHRITRVLPHIIDTFFLASAFVLMFMLKQYPFVDSWLTAKVFGLIGYIMLGSMALKHGRGRKEKITTFFAALVVFAWVASVAWMKTPLGFLA